MAETSYNFCGSKCRHPAYTKNDADGLFFLKDRIFVIEGNVTIDAQSNYTLAPGLPDGFTKDNCIVISAMVSDSTDEYRYPRESYTSIEPFIVILGSSGINILIKNDKNVSRDFYYKIAFMRYKD